MSKNVTIPAAMLHEFLQAMQEVRELHKTVRRLEKRLVGEEWISVAECARRLGVTSANITRLCREGKLEAEQVATGGKWRIREESIGRLSEVQEGFSDPRKLLTALRNETIILTDDGVEYKKPHQSRRAKRKN